ncbi:hypothetical protein H2201_008010 [Coniosporium apollinis]|uniref:ZZ-type domain-containing protein n=1 Tax=Coniosporium apollinis TaxID=61459 RepID=A0ABQ9NK69_9PEZI|nr:hypothetical protein H2201_008010 [Coniosporium apollinis]
MATNLPITADTLITVKISIQGSNRKFKIPLRDLEADVLPSKLRSLLAIPPNQEVVFERFSDSAGAYITLDTENPHVYKTLFRAAKAKLKLRLRATLPSENNEQAPQAPKPTEGAPAAPSIASSSRPYCFNMPPLPVPAPTGLLDAYASMRPPRAPYARTIPVTGPTPEAARPSASSSKTAVNLVDAGGEAPVPRSFAARENFFAELANISRQREMALRMKEAPVPTSWSVYCNECDKPMANEHYHCSICDDGDYDLCGSCVDSGVHCPGQGHWLIKRFVQSGKVVNSTTEMVGPKNKSPTEKEMPGAFTEEKKVEVEEPEVPSRTCNCCVKVLPEIEPATAQTSIGPLAEFLCAPGRNVRHSAICDGCDKTIYGVRHKCLVCPDFDFCGACTKNSKYIHPGHRFVPIYEPLPEPRANYVRHYGIYCDGPLCKGKDTQSYIEGVRYKCAVCHDTDFCANCEALPSNRHNRTHPLIKFKTPVRNVSVTTMGEDKHGIPLATMGDHQTRRSMATETVPVAPAANAATEVQTIVDLKPSEEPAAKPANEKIEIKSLLTEPITEKIKVEDLLTTPVPEMSKAEVEVTPTKPVAPKSEAPKPVPASELNAHFIRDTIPDLSRMVPSQRFIQGWTLRNPGPHAWPAGCSVRYTGGDNMLNIDRDHPSSATDMAEATESNVIGREVPVGEEVTFRVIMKAPTREGRAISYWRLKAADGTPFGHRLWCDINVFNELPPVPTSSRADKVQGRVHPPLFPAPLSPPTEARVGRGNKILQDYQMQLMLLEQENKKLLLKKRAEQRALDQIEQFFGKAEVSPKKEAVFDSVPKPAEPIVKPEPETKTEVPAAAAAAEPEKPKEAEPTEVTKTEPEPEPETSQMVFPQLPKESPVSSTHEAVTAPSAARTETETDANPMSPSAASEELEFFEDAETVEMEDATSDEDGEGFVTDEEYDVLDASDEELK